MRERESLAANESKTDCVYQYHESISFVVCTIIVITNAAAAAEMLLFNIGSDCKVTFVAGGLELYVN